VVVSVYGGDGAAMEGIFGIVFLSQST